MCPRRFPSFAVNDGRNGNGNLLRYKSFISHVTEKLGDALDVRDVVALLVGADGVRSLVRRQVVGPIPRQHLGLAVGYWVQGAPDAIVFQTYSDLGGYLWSFPRADQASVGIVTRLGAVPPRDLWHRVDRFLDKVSPGTNEPARYAGLLPMAGDASLEGIAYALWSADLLAEALVGGDPRNYENLWREHYGQALISSGEMLCRAGGAQGAYEVLFQLALAMAFSAPG